jgi:hypothetical protein
VCDPVTCSTTITTDVTSVYHKFALFVRPLEREPRDLSPTMRWAFLPRRRSVPAQPLFGEAESHRRDISSEKTSA